MTANPANRCKSNFNIGFYPVWQPDRGQVSASNPPEVPKSLSEIPQYLESSFSIRPVNFLSNRNGSIDRDDLLRIQYFDGQKEVVFVEEFLDSEDYAGFGDPQERLDAVIGAAAVYVSELPFGSQDGGLPLSEELQSFGESCTAHGLSEFLELNRRDKAAPTEPQAEHSLESLTSYRLSLTRELTPYPSSQGFSITPMDSASFERGVGQTTRSSRR